LAEMSRSHRRRKDEIRGAVRHQTRQILLPGIHAGQQKCREQRFESATHKEAFIGTLSQSPARTGIEGEYAEAPAMTPFNLRERCLGSA
jgi:hypothetical protein